MITTAPKLEYRSEQPYVAVRMQVNMQSLATAADTFPEVFAWLERKGVKPVGAPFIRYLVVDDVLDLEVGSPVPSGVPGFDRMISGILPAGRYAVLLHTGPYAGLRDATASLLAWAEESGITWQMSEDGRVWGARLEYYLTDPGDEPDPKKYQTEIAFLVAEG